MKRYIWVLVMYYGVLQVLHIAMNIVLLFRPEFMLWASPILDLSESRYLLISLYIDFLVASPLGILGVGMYVRKHNKALMIIIISLCIALISAGLYIGILLYFEAFVLSVPTIIFGCAFAPAFVLLIRLCYYRNHES